MRAWLPWLFRLLAASTALCTLVATVLVILDRLRVEFLVALAVATLLNGLFHLARALVHWFDDEYWRRPRARALVRLDLWFGATWLGLAALLILSALLITLPVVVPALGAVVTLGVAVVGFLIALQTAHLEKKLDIPGGSAFVATWPPVRGLRILLAGVERYRWARWLRDVWGRKMPLGEVSTYLACTFAMTLCLAGAYAGLAAAEVANQLVIHAQSPPPAKDQPLGRAGAGEQSGEADVLPRPDVDQAPPPPPTYAELCERLPDPQDVGLGLGDLFESAGAVAAGCGERARRVGESLVIAAGRCDDELRSLAVRGESGEAVLLYGAAAEFADEAAEAGFLSDAEVGAAGDGELAIVTTVGGTYAFASPVPSVEVAGAVRCESAHVNPPAPRVPPPLAQLWLDQVREDGWSWPREDDPAAGSFSFIADEGKVEEEVVAEASCDGDSFCLLDGSAGRRSSEGSASVSLADFAPFMP